MLEQNWGRKHKNLISTLVPVVNPKLWESAPKHNYDDLSTENDGRPITREIKQKTN